MESKETRLVWVTMLAMKDADGVVRASPKGLAHRARVSEEECKEALGILCGPDEESSSKVEGGRRIKKVGGGWLIVNHEEYRYSTEEARREKWRMAKERERSRKKSGGPGGVYLSREARYEKALAGGDREGADRIAAEGLNEKATG